MRKARKIWQRLSPTVRWLLVTLLILTMTAGGIYAYKALTARVEVTVEECLSFVGPSSFQVSLYPGESETVQVTVANASSVDINVDLASAVVPDPGLKGLTVNIPNKITAPANGEVVVNILIEAGKSAEPTTYSITIDFER